MKTTITKKELMELKEAGRYIPDEVWTKLAACEKYHRPYIIRMNKYGVITVTYLHRNNVDMPATLASEAAKRIPIGAPMQRKAKARA